MLRCSFYIVLMLCSASLLQAQSKRHWGLSYAPTWAQFEHYGAKLKQDRYGQQACVQYYINTERHFSFRFGLGYSFTQATYEFKMPAIGNTDITRFKHQDILLPVQVQFASPGKSNRLYLAAGLMPSINVGRKATLTSYYFNSSNPIYSDITNEQSDGRMDLFMTLGLGYEFRLKAGGRCFIQPGFQSNMPAQLIYIVKYLFDAHRGTGPSGPPIVNMLGIEFGYYLQ